MTTRGPASADPHCAVPGPDHPASAHPNPSAAVPGPIARRPKVIWAWRYGDDFTLRQRRWRLGSGQWRRRRLGGRWNLRGRRNGIGGSCRRGRGVGRLRRVAIRRAGLPGRRLLINRHVLHAPFGTAGHQRGATGNQQSCSQYSRFHKGNHIFLISLDAPESPRFGQNCKKSRLRARRKAA